MVYIICYDWPSTSGNHTGMRYLYEYIQKEILNYIKCILLIWVGVFWIREKGEENLCVFTALKLAMTYKSGDKFILTEYLHRDSYQILFAK